MDPKKASAEEFKVKGNDEYNAKNYLKAKEYYTKAIGINFLSN